MIDGSNSAATSALHITHPTFNIQHSILLSIGKQINSPSQLELSPTYTNRHIPIKGRAEGYKLQFLSITEQPLGGLVEPLRDVVERVGGAVFRRLEFLCIYA